jgi:hypothetical protein
MSDNTLGRTAEEFRAAVRLAAERGNLTASANAAAAPVDIDAIVAAIEGRMGTAVGEAVRREITAQIGEPVDQAVRRALADQAAPSIDPQLVARLEAAAEQLPHGDSDVMLHLRNILPGQMRQEMHQQNQQVMQRFAALEGQVAAVQADNGLGRDLIRVALTGLVVAVIVIGVTIFERQLQNWGRDAIYPLFGISIKEATSTALPAAKAATPREVK